MTYRSDREQLPAHWRGIGTAPNCSVRVGWDVCGCRLRVKNDRSLKVGKWWAGQVQISEVPQ